MIDWNKYEHRKCGDCAAYWSCKNIDDANKEACGDFEECEDEEEDESEE